MVLLSFLAFLLFPMSCLLAQEHSTCPKDFHCSNLGLMSFPFTNTSQPNCGLCFVDCDSQRLYLWSSDQVFDAVSTLNNSIKLRDLQLKSLLREQSCSTFYYEINLPKNSSVSFQISSNTTTIFRCSSSRYLSPVVVDHFHNNGYVSNTSCDDFQLFYRNPKKYSTSQTRYSPTGCSAIHLPMISWDLFSNESKLFDLLSFEFDLQWNLHPQNARNDRLIAIIITAAGIAGVAFFNVVTIFLIWRCKKRIEDARYLRSRPDLHDGSAYLGIPIFSYSELEQITKNFHASNELGDGGYGTVYYGKLEDGREVAVKRLYEHNFKRMEQQFINEIRILTRLKHRNLVTLYGCTSRHFHELLLVYEYIPNGTVADHLHGDRAKHKSLTWPVRMNIAIETAGALAYLHASDIIHRDVKTNNILLDHNFQVKVADFGLSRLFPEDVSHISTAPQGTPGYVDPEYHHCYQVNDKSDVYSFGVVLIELVSSMPAVDISRKRHEINLAELAINRIQKCALHELIDPSLGFETDFEVLRMTTSVAELAFRCLQLEKEMRPTMAETLESLKAIQDCNETFEAYVNTMESRSTMLPYSPESQNVLLLKRSIKIPSLPKSVSDDLCFSSSSKSSTSR